MNRFSSGLLIEYGGESDTVELLRQLGLAEEERQGDARPYPAVAA